jgi:hypothetical protein
MYDPPYVPIDHHTTPTGPSLARVIHTPCHPYAMRFNLASVLEFVLACTCVALPLGWSNLAPSRHAPQLSTSSPPRIQQSCAVSHQADTRHRALGGAQHSMVLTILIK